MIFKSILNRVAEELHMKHKRNRKAFAKNQKRIDEFLQSIHGNTTTEAPISTTNDQQQQHKHDEL